MIRLDNITKTLNKKTVLDHISYEFEQGKIYGLHGINGSGKTMLIRALSGLLVLDEGSIEVDGKILNKDIDFPDSMGVIIENMEMLGQNDAYTNLEIIGDIKKIVTPDDIHQTLERVGLAQYDKLKVHKYSLGMKQRLNIAQAIMERPRYLLLDEPFNALDDSGRKMLYEILDEERKKGRTIVIAHHYKEELEKICDVIVEMKEGKII